MTLLADDFRIQHEKKVLFGSILIICFLLLVIIQINPIIPICLILFSAGWIKIGQKQLLGNAVMVSDQSLSQINEIAKKAAKNLSMEKPEVFVTQSPELNAYAIGLFGKKSVVLYSGLVEILSDEELLSVIGHEFGHIKCGHTIWGTIIGTKNLVQIPIISKSFEFLFLYWSRKSELSADRGGLIACKNLKLSIRTLIKLAVGEKLYEEVNVDAFLDQKNDDKIISSIGELLFAHPYLANRIKYLSEFYSSEIYKNICQNCIKRDDAVLNETLENVYTLIKNKDFQNLIKKKITSSKDTITSISKEAMKLLEQPQLTATDDKNFPQKDILKQAIKPKEKIHVKKKHFGIEKKKIGVVKKDKSILHAVLDENVHQVIKLLEQGIDPNTEDESGDTGLHIAIQLENYKVAKCLLDYGALPTLENNLGETSFHVTKNNKSKQLFELLKKYNNLKS